MTRTESSAGYRLPLIRSFTAVALVLGTALGATVSTASADEVTIANPETAVDMQIPGLVLDLGGIPLQLFTASPRTGSLPESFAVAQGFGVTWTWVNLNTGASGVIPASDDYRTDVYAGPGQIVVTANISNQITPAVGTFYLAPARG